MKGLLYVPFAMVLSAIAAGLILRGFTGHVDVRTLATAAAIATLAAEAAMLPLVLVRHAGPVGTSQAALGGTMIHLFVTFALGATAYLMKLVGRRDLFLFMLLGFYWVSLIFIVTAMAKSIRRSSANGKSAATTTVVTH
jgi:hypothetical protein